MDIKRELYDVIGIAEATGRVRCRTPADAGQGHLDSLNRSQTAINQSRFSVGYDLNRVLIDKVTMDFGFPVADFSGRIKAVFFATVNLDWMNRLAERLEWREAQLRESESSRTPDAILGVDGDFLLSFRNQGAEQMFAWQREHLEGMDLRQLEGSGGKSTRSKTLVGALREIGRERVEAFFVRRDGMTFRADIRVTGGTQRQIQLNLIVRESGE